MASIERLINAAQGDEIIAALDRISNSENGRDEFDTSKIMISVFAGANANSVFSYSYNGKICVTSVPTGVQTVIYCDPDTDFSINMVQLTSSFKAVCQDSTFSWPTPDDGYVTATAKTIMPNDTFRIHLPAFPGVGGFYMDYTSATYRLYQAWGIMAGTQIQMTTGLPTMTISFDANGGTGTGPADMVLPVYATIDTPANTFIREGYAFMGWSTNPNSGLEGTPYATGQDDLPISVWKASKQTQRFLKIGTDTTLYAIWINKSIIEYSKRDYSTTNEYWALEASASSNVLENGDMKFFDVGQTITLSETVALTLRRRNDAGIKAAARCLETTAYGSVIYSANQRSTATVSKSATISNANLGYISLSANCTYDISGDALGCTLAITQSGDSTLNFA